MSKLRVIIVSCLLILILAGGGYSIYYKNHIEPIPPGSVGNTAGNIRGEGLFCEYDGKVYFSNAYDNGKLYVMNPDGSDLKKLGDFSASYINAGGKYLFYYMESAKGGSGLGYVRSMTGIYRSTLDGDDVYCLNDDLTTMMVLIGDHIYYQHYDNQNFSTFNKLALDNSKEDLLLSKEIIETADAVGNTLYYAGVTNDHYLYGFNTLSDSAGIVWQGNLACPTVIDSYVYYMDIDHDYRLCRYNTADNRIEVLSNERLDFYNYYNGTIYYQVSGKTPALKRMNADGTDQVTIAEGTYNRINCTSAYTYFYEFGEDALVHRTPTFGPPSVDNFPAALEVALKEN